MDSDVLADAALVREILGLYRRGYSEEQISQRVRVTIAAVRIVVAKRLNVRLKPASWTAKLDIELTRRARELWRKDSAVRSGSTLTRPGFKVLAARMSFPTTGEALRRRAARIRLDARPWWRRIFGGA